MHGGPLQERMRIARSGPNKNDKCAQKRKNKRNARRTKQEWEMHAEKESTRRKCTRTNKEREVRARNQSKNNWARSARVAKNKKCGQTSQENVVLETCWSSWLMEYFLHGGSKGTTKNVRGRCSLSQLRRLISNFVFIFIDELITALISKKWFHIMMHVDRLYKNFTQWSSQKWK